MRLVRYSSVTSRVRNQRVTLESSMEIAGRRLERTLTQWERESGGAQNLVAEEGYAGSFEFMLA